MESRELIINWHALTGLPDVTTPASGVIRILPTRYWPGIPTVVDKIAQINIDDVETTVTVPVTPPGEALRIECYPDDASPWCPVVVIPPGDGPLYMHELTPVDPVTLAPSATPKPLWQVLLEDTRDDLDALKTAMSETARVGFDVDGTPYLIGA